MFWRLYVQIEKRNAEEEKAGGVQVVDLLAFSTANTKKGKKSVLHTQQKKKEEKKRRACPFRSFTICVRVYMRCVCVSYCVQTLAETHPIYTHIYLYVVRMPRWQALVDCCCYQAGFSFQWHTIFIFFICSNTWDLFSFISYTHSSHTHTLIFAYLRILLYMLCVCCSSLFALDSISIRNVYRILSMWCVHWVYSFQYMRKRRKKITCNFHLCWRLIAALLPIHNTFFFSFFVWFLFLFPSVCVCVRSFFSMVRNDFR